MPDRLAEIRQRLECACQHLNAVLTMVEKETLCQDVLHPLHAIGSALQAIGKRLVLCQVEEIEILIKNSSSSEERVAQPQSFIPLTVLLKRTPTVLVTRKILKESSR